MSLLNKILVGTGISLLVGAILGKNKIDNVKSIVDNLKIKLTKIKGINIVGNTVVLTVDLAIENQTDLEFSLNAGNLINLKKIQFYNLKGTLIAEAQKTINNIVLPPKSSVPLHNLDVVISSSNILVIAGQLISATPTDFIVKAQIEILGQPYTI